MAATRRFDEEQVLQAAMEVFWRKGYEGSSIEDLEAATALKRGSLYNAYGNKEQIFLLALDRYQRVMEAELLRALEEEDIESAVRAVLDLQLRTLSDRDLPPGCLIANALSEPSCAEGRIGAALRERMLAAESRVYDRLVEAQAKGEISPGKDLRALARYIVAIMRLLPTLYRIGRDRRAVGDVAEVALQALR